MMSMSKQATGTRLMRTQRGFTLLEVMISIVVLTIGLISLCGLFGLAVSATQTAQQDMIAKQLANEAVESLFTARNSSQLLWSSIQNVSNGGIFLDGFQNINLAGGDGIIGTADDSAAGPQMLNEPGPDGIMNTADDIHLSLANYQRQIQINPLFNADGSLNASLRQLVITVQYNTPQGTTPKTYTVASYISEYH
ncbi:MAG: prepilin-type N-terminal cleavage/methylation domain-containing protein [Acidobacteria bacterium]|nr:prepilin-type N-terminal cleavage/methylation domain-containing protein [Acidobacteriota bacterium]